MKFVILLTACINPGGMSFTKLIEPNERMSQYINALKFYLTHTVIPIVFVENSKTDISYLFENEIRCKRLEMFTFQGENNLERGKGYGEAEIIEYAINNSTIINKDSSVIKITGRLIVNNISSLINQLLLGILPQSSVICVFNSDLTTADSRIIIAPCNFYKLFLKNKNQINDSNMIFFEHILSNAIKKQKKYCYFPFIKEPEIIGVSGSTGTEYTIEEMSFKSKLLYLQYRLQQQIRLTTTEHLRRLHPIRNLIVYLLYQILRIVNTV